VGAPAAGAAAAAPAAVAIPSAPAGVGAPALTDATHLIPLPAVAASAPSAPAAPAQPAPSPSLPEPVAADGPAPAMAAGAAATATAVAEAPPELDTTGGGNGVSGDTASHPLFDEPEEEPLPRVQLRPGGAQPRPLPPLRQPPSRGSSRAAASPRCSRCSVSRP
jgi:hypothetical protein